MERKMVEIVDMFNDEIRFVYCDRFRVKKDLCH